MVPLNPTSLSVLNPDEFLPPISRWSRLGGLALVGLFGGAIALAAVLQYNVTVKAPAVVRPKGDLRIVESAASGRVQRILVKTNDQVEQGDPIAILDDAELKSQQQQIQAELDQLQRQRGQIQEELTALTSQIQAETGAMESAIAAAQAQLALRQRDYRDQQTTTTATLREAEAAQQLAQEELNRYRELAGTGALADLQLKEKEAALATAQARVDKNRALLNPSVAAVSQAEADIQQAQAHGNATLAGLRQTQESLARQQADLDKQLQVQQQELHQIQIDLEQLTIRAPIAGTIQSLALRNPNQVLEVGEAIAQIAPAAATVVIQAQVSQADISRIALGQTANIRVDSCPYTDYGLLTGRVATIAPDAGPPDTAPDAMATVYQVELVPDGHSLQSAQRTCTLQSGMRGRADLITQRETVLQTLERRLRLFVRL